MDIFSALQTSVSGLQAQSYAISNISGNIANSQTTGYKRIDTSFVDLMAETTPKREVAGTVLAQAQLTNSLQGNVIASQIPTNMAINGQGFFTVALKTGDAGGQATFGATNLYTRRGDFAQDKDGYLVNGAGAFLTGSNVDPNSGQVTGTGPIKIGNMTLPAKQTTTINYAANLPATPITNASVKSTAAGAYLYTGALAMTATGAPASTGGAADVAALMDNSIVGPSVTAYTENGAPVAITTRWAKVQDATPDGAQDAVWNLFYQSASGSAAGVTPSTPPVWTNIGAAFTFDAAGQPTTTATGPIPIPDLEVNGIELDGVSLNIGTGGLTQYANTSGAATTNTLTQNGNSAGTLTSVAVGSDGNIKGTFSNGTVATVATVGIARFTNPDGLKPDSRGNYLQTDASGGPLSGLNGGTISGASLEQSNTDIASEFSKMIVTQQAYSANTRVMSTAQTMMSDLMNVIR
ncbi:flagellar hook-basal body complex protein [Methylobacterium sp. NEAU 140]|uniref:flagellar hook protein FlgE n=1 Tax=Methylobacterium sp. NEAU 140 TaxID=3064945 RepID=UPI0027325E2B|nr:flagellar hook-basal body complex protein [Methylobacterium sp. NEAU 140]MDP4022625.1 flagellar hook-basal body complex protein [Methylobacterium sp. NEAU 140]